MPSPPHESPSHCPEISAWWPTPVPPNLGDGELHLWKLDDPDRPPPALDPWPLSRSERERAQQLRNPAVHDTFVHSRYAMRHILGAYLGIDPGAVRFAEGAHGKPHIDHPEARLQYNLTHSGRLCLLAVTRNLQVGLDTEKTTARRSLEAIAARMFDEQSLRQLRSLPEQQQPHLFFLYWTRMEAMVKARGGGLFADHSRQLPALPHACFLPHPGFQACVAVDGPCPPISEWRTLRFDHTTETNQDTTFSP